MSRCAGSQTFLASFARIRHDHRSHALIETLTQLRVEALGSSGLSMAVVRPTGIEPKSQKNPGAAHRIIEAMNLAGLTP